MLTVLIDGSPAMRKVSRAPVGFRYSKDLNAEATGHGGMYYNCHLASKNIKVMVKVIKKLN